MCGIAGVLDWRGHGYAPAKDMLADMISQLHHRGPDGYGYLLGPQIGLAHARLSIIDLAGGSQPIHNEDRTLWVVFNGEIFNYIELRAALEDSGHRFYTHSDTEVIVHLYEQYGDEFVQHLNGQFAIAIWDSRRERLVLTRDRVGIAPLFFHAEADRVVFASEIKAILPALDTTPAVNFAALNQLMTFWAPVSPHTMFAGVRELAPGTQVIVDRNGLRERRYWDWLFPQSPDDYLQGGDDELAEQVRALLIDATRIRLRADVPVGAYLSGGLDSSILTSLIHHHSDAPLRTFSIGFEDAQLDESPYQRQMIEHLNARHSHVTCSNVEVGANFVDTIWHTEIPVMRTAPVPMQLLSRRVRAENYKVVLTGEGADEVFGGYDLFKEAKIRQFWARQPQSKWRQNLLRQLYPYLQTTSSQAQFYLQNFYGIGLDRPAQPAFSHLPRWDTSGKVRMFLNPELQAHGDNAVDAFLETLPAAMEQWHPFNRAQYLEAKQLMAGYLLCSQGDRMLMANSVEGRFPFLDHRVIEFANRLHPRRKMRVLQEKYLLKRSMERYLPAAIVNRHKQPYRAPDAAAFFDPVTKMPLPFVDELLSAARIRDFGYFDPKRVEMLHRKARNGAIVGARDNQALVAILATQAWHSLFVERRHSTRAGAGSTTEQIHYIEQ